MALLGDDGLGYELALKLESHGVWRPWLGDALYSTFLPYLSSPANWDAFMRPDHSKTKPQIYLHLRARALLFDKASLSHFTKSPSISNLNPNYLELHGDDVYFTLENSSQDAEQRRPGLAASNTTFSKGQSKTSTGAGPRFSEPEEFPETWYTQFFEKYKTSKSYRLMFGGRESEKRTPEQMSTYIRVLDNNKRSRIPFRDSVSNSRTNFSMDNSTVVDDTPLFPEMMFTLNCVPDSAVLKTGRLENNQNVKFNGVLDDLPRIMTRSPVIRPEYLNMEQVHQGHGKAGYQGNRKLLCQEQASQMSKKVVVRLLHNLGFGSSSETSLEVMGQLLSCHISKLGRILKLLADSYRQQCSATELLKMFLQTAGYRNFGPLMELMKADTKKVAHQTTQQRVLGTQAQLQPQPQSSIQQSQQIIRQMSPQMQLMNNPQYLALQQQERMRRMQQLTPRPGMNMNTNMNTNTNNIDKDRALVQVKMEYPSDFPVDTNNAFNTAMNSRQQQFRHQQLAAMSHAQSNVFRPMTTSQVPQILSPTMTMARAPHVKVEGFQELMGGDSSMKHDSENKLPSPQN